MKTTLRDWQARPFMPHADMQGEYCKLTPLCPGAHGGELWDAFAADKRGMDWRYLPYGPFADKRAFMKWLRLITGGIDPQFYAILDNDGAAVGMASYLNIVPLHGVVEVGHIHYAPCLQRTAAATETMFLMMRRAFAEVGYRRYEWKCDSRNRRSCAAALRLGFRADIIFCAAPPNAPFDINTIQSPRCATSATCLHNASLLSQTFADDNTLRKSQVSFSSLAKTTSAAAKESASVSPKTPAFILLDAASTTARIRLCGYCSRNAAIVAL